MSNQTFTSFLLLNFLFISCAFADAPDNTYEQRYAVRPSGKVKGNSMAEFDKRLPPVLPGQEITNGDQKMNVWSTSGSVRPAIPTVSSKDDLGQIVVDGRDFMPKNTGTSSIQTGSGINNRYNKSE